MSTIGLDKLYYSTITESAVGDETYATPVILAKAITADLSIEVNEATLYADDGASESVKEFKSGTLALGINDLGAAKASALVGCVVDENGVVVSGSDDTPPYVAIGFRARKSSGQYKYFWLYRVKFAVPGVSLATKGESIEFKTPTIEGTIYRRNKVDGFSNHPWKAEADSGDTGIAATTITNWFTTVYEPTAPST